MTDGSTHPIGQVRLPVTFGEFNNYRTELIDFNVADIRLPYNGILGYPALAKFMAATHHGYNILKMIGSSGIITVACQEKDAVCSLKRAYQAEAVENLEDEDSALPPKVVPRTKKLQLGQGVMPRIQLSIFVTPTLAISGYVICYFLCGWVFVCCFAFCSCHASRLMSSFALHRHRFHKTCIRS